MKQIKYIILTLGIIAGFGLAAWPSAASAQVNVFPDCNTVAGKKTAICKARNGDDVGDLLKKVVNALLFVLGAAAVLMIVVGGVSYTLSNGDATLIKNAKDKILYSVIGLIVALLAYAIVNFVLTALG